jgi:hypothetical protein
VLAPVLKLLYPHDWPWMLVHKMMRTR